jgi:hypothetical protein
MHNTISVRAQVIGSLKYPRQDKEYFLSEFIHGKRLMGRIPVQKKALEEKRQIPVSRKEYEYHLHENMI